jgi:hypothetical protein
VANVDYETSSGLKGTTDEKGYFQYKQGDTVYFKVGKVVIGSVKMDKPDPIVEPKDLVADDVTDPAEVEQKAIKISALLIGLDEDGNPDNGIKVPDEVKTTLEKLENEVELDKVDLTDETVVTTLKNIKITKDINGDGQPDEVDLSTVITEHEDDAKAHYTKTQVEILYKQLEKFKNEGKQFYFSDNPNVMCSIDNLNVVEKDENDNILKFNFEFTCNEEKYTAEIYPDTTTGQVKIVDNNQYEYTYLLSAGDSICVLPSGSPTKLCLYFTDPENKEIKIDGYAFFAPQLPRFDYVKGENGESAKITKYIQGKDGYTIKVVYEYRGSGDIYDPANYQVSGYEVEKVTLKEKEEVYSCRITGYDKEKNEDIWTEYTENKTIPMELDSNEVAFYNEVDCSLIKDSNGNNKFKILALKETEEEEGEEEYEWYLEGYGYITKTENVKEISFNDYLREEFGNIASPTAYYFVRMRNENEYIYGEMNPGKDFNKDNMVNIVKVVNGITLPTTVPEACKGLANYMDTPTSDNPTDSNQIIDITEYITPTPIIFERTEYIYNNQDGYSTNITKYFKLDNGYTLEIDYGFRGENTNSNGEPCDPVKDIYDPKCYGVSNLFVSKIEDGSYKEYYKCGIDGEKNLSTNIPLQIEVGKQYIVRDGVVEFYPPKAITYDNIKDSKGNNIFNTLIAKYTPNDPNNNDGGYPWLIEKFGYIETSKSSDILELEPDMPEGATLKSYEKILFFDTSSYLYTSNIQDIGTKVNNLNTLANNLTIPDVFPAQCQNIIQYVPDAKVAELVDISSFISNFSNKISLGYLKEINTDENTIPQIFTTSINVRKYFYTNQDYIIEVSYKSLASLHDDSLSNIIDMLSQDKEILQPTEYIVGKINKDTGSYEEVYRCAIENDNIKETNQIITNIPFKVEIDKTYLAREGRIKFNKPQIKTLSNLSMDYTFSKLDNLNILTEEYVDEEEKTYYTWFVDGFGYIGYSNSITNLDLTVEDEYIQQNPVDYTKYFYNYLAFIVKKDGSYLAFRQFEDKSLNITSDDINKLKNYIESLPFPQPPETCSALIQKSFGEIQ